ncbi:MAG: ATP-binding protein [Acidobacteriota bacterium]|nr:ATP-binding protein [Acidobacteriota bacterium]
MVFSDRIEIWNPGGLPFGLTLEALKKPHPSLPRNKLIAECFHLSGYIEKAGSGIIEMIKRCKEKGLPEPEFEEKMGCFVTVIYRSIITDKYLDSLGLNERQRKSIEYLRKKQKITSREYCELCSIAKDTANRDLNDLLNKEVIEKRGIGPQIFYVLKAIVRWKKGRTIIVMNLKLLTDYEK